MTSRSFLMIRINPAEQQELVLTINVKGIHISDKNIAIWDDNQVRK